MSTRLPGVSSRQRSCSLHQRTCNLSLPSLSFCQQRTRESASAGHAEWRHGSCMPLSLQQHPTAKAQQSLPHLSPPVSQAALSLRTSTPQHCLAFYLCLQRMTMMLRRA